MLMSEKKPTKAKSPNFGDELKKRIFLRKEEILESEHLDRKFHKYLGIMVQQLVQGTSQYKSIKIKRVEDRDAKGYFLHVYHKKEIISSLEVVPNLGKGHTVHGSTIEGKKNPAYRAVVTNNKDLKMLSVKFKEHSEDLLTKLTELLA